MSVSSRIAGLCALFVTIVAFANISAWAGAWAIHNLPLGLDALVLVGTPVLLFLLPGLVMRRVVKARKKRDTAAGDSLLAHTATGWLIFGILCPFSMLIVCPASGEWIHLRTGEAAESVPVEQALQHRDAVYLSVTGAQVLASIRGSERISTGRDSYRTYHASPIAPLTTGAASDGKSPGAQAVLSVTAAVEKHQPFELWLSADSKAKLASIQRGATFGGTVLKGGDSLKSIQDAVAKHGLEPVDDPLVIELGASTYEGALDRVWLWAAVALGLYNLFIAGLAGLYCYNRRQ